MFSQIMLIIRQEYPMKLEMLQFLPAETPNFANITRKSER